MNTIPHGWIESTWKIPDGCSRWSEKFVKKLKELHVIFVDSTEYEDELGYRVKNSKDMAVFLLPHMDSNPTSLEEGPEVYLGTLIKTLIQCLNHPSEVRCFPAGDGRLVISLEA